MPFKPYQNMQSQSQPQPQQGDEWDIGYSGLLPRTALALGRGIEAPFRMASGVSGAVGGPQATFPTDLLAQKLGYTPESLKPQTGLERVTQGIAESGPVSAALAAATGGTALIPMALRGVGFGNVLAGGAKAIGLPESVQNIIEGVGSFGYGLGTGGIPTVGAKQKAAYESARSVAGESKHPFSGVKNAIKVAREKLGTAPVDIKKDVEKAISVVESNISKKGLSWAQPKKMMEVRKTLYEEAQKLPYDKRHYISDVAKSITNSFFENGARNPDLYKQINKGDLLTQMKYAKGYFADKLKNSDWASALQRAGEQTGILPRALSTSLEFVTKEIMDRPERWWKNIMTNPAARKHYADFWGAVAKNNPMAALRSWGLYQQETPSNKKGFSAERKGFTPYGSY